MTVSVSSSSISVQKHPVLGLSDHLHSCIPCGSHHTLLQHHTLRCSSIADNSQVCVYAMLILIAGNYEVLVPGASSGITSIRNFIKVRPAILEMKRADGQISLTPTFVHLTHIMRVTHKNVVYNKMILNADVLKNVFRRALAPLWRYCI
jgi:hypothetical protein